MTIPTGVEERTRVICTLPLESNPLAPDYFIHIDGFAAVLSYIETQQKYGFGVDGYTLSIPGAYRGLWRDASPPWR